MSWRLRDLRDTESTSSQLRVVSSYQRGGGNIVLSTIELVIPQTLLLLLFSLISNITVLQTNSLKLRSVC